MKLIDESTGKTSQGVTLTRVYEHNGHLVQVQVERDDYERQSHAAARLLATGKTWTVLITEPTSNWHRQNMLIADVADTLASRTVRILNAVPGL